MTTQPTQINRARYTQVRSLDELHGAEGKAIEYRFASPLVRGTRRAQYLGSACHEFAFVEFGNNNSSVFFTTVDEDDIDFDLDDGRLVFKAVNETIGIHADESPQEFNNYSRSLREAGL